MIPARNEAETIAAASARSCARTIRASSPSSWSTTKASDGTADIARQAADAAGAAHRLTVVAGKPLPAGWTGKLWAMKQGVERALERA